MNMSLKSKLFFSKNFQGLLNYFWNERNNHIIAEWPIKQSATNCIRFAAIFKQSGQSHCVCYHLKAEWLITLCLLSSPSRATNHIEPVRWPITLCLLPSPSRVVNHIVFTVISKQSIQSHCVCCHLQAEWPITLCLLQFSSIEANHDVFAAISK